jgi:hypothetical protein
MTHIFCIFVIIFYYFVVVWGNSVASLTWYHEGVPLGTRWRGKRCGLAQWGKP